MTINDAIETLSDIANDLWDADNQEVADACRLGIKALKVMKEKRGYPENIIPGELGGETS